MSHKTRPHKTRPQKPRVELVWFKRDLRIHDHAPLCHAAAAGRVLPLYVIEPELWFQPDASNRHWSFIRAALVDLREQLATLGQGLLVRQGDICEVLASLQTHFDIAAVHAHQETGNAWTFQRDLQVQAWLRERGIAFLEYRQQGVLRGKVNRDHWADAWDRFMQAPVIETPCALPKVCENLGEIPRLLGGQSQPFALQEMIATRAAAEQQLDGFLAQQVRRYPAGIGRPGARQASSRLSAHLAWGSLSLREVVQQVDRLRAENPDQRGLKQFKSRLYWHCHFIQKLESEPEMEFRELNPAFAGLRGSAEDAQRLAAWERGETGWPLVDACMRSLRATGWLNFRMRAMLISIASNQLWMPWQMPARYLAKLFVDYEPGIHYPQVQMQSGTTGINQLRLYNPTKQSQDQDPNGQFIRRWVPALRQVPAQWIHTPWLMPQKLQQAYGVRLDTDYPLPLVDQERAAQSAREQVYAVKRSSEARQFSAEIVSKHASRRRRAQGSRSQRGKAGSSQMELF